MASLPGIVKDAPATGLYIYTGEVTGNGGTYANGVLEVYYNGQTPTLRVIHTGANELTVYTLPDDEFVSVNIGSTSTPLAAQVIAGAGLEFGYSSALIQQIDFYTKDKVVGRIDPTD